MYARAYGAMHPPALFAAKGDGSGERLRSENLNRALLSRHALGETREFTIKGWGGEPVQMYRHVSAEFRSEAAAGR